MTDPDPCVLVVDDEPSIRRFLRVSLTAHGYAVVEAANGQDALALAVVHRPDLIILDLGLPDIDGLEVTRQLREWATTPIVILSVRGGEDDKVAVLDAGADDYVTKPFGVAELLARMRVAMRHAPSTGEPVITVGDLTLDMAQRRVIVRGQEVQLTPTEYGLLRTLVVHAGRVMTHRQLMREVWGEGYNLDTHLLRVNVSNLRRKIEQDPTRPAHIETEPGVGYRLSVEA